MTFPQITGRRDGQNMIVSAHFGERTAIAAHREGSPFDASVQSLLNSIASVGIAAAAAAERLQPVALVAEIRQGMRSEVRPAYQRVVKAVQTRKQQDAMRLAKLGEATGDLPLASEDRAEFRALPTGEMMRWIKGASRDQLAAIVSAGRSRFPNVGDAPWSAATDRLELLNLIALAGKQAEHSLKPTVNDPAAVGPDTDAAEAWANEQVQNIKDEMAAVGHAERTLRDVAVVASVACDLPLNDAYALLAEAA